MTCTCSELHLNGGSGRGTGIFNLNYDCPDHGTKSAWYKSPEQVAKRAGQNEKSLELQARARFARTGEWPSYWHPRGV